MKLLADLIKLFISNNLATISKLARERDREIAIDQREVKLSRGPDLEMQQGAWSRGVKNPWRRRRRTARGSRASPCSLQTPELTCRIRQRRRNDMDQLRTPNTVQMKPYILSDHVPWMPIILAHQSINHIGADQPRARAILISLFSATIARRIHRRTTAARPGVWKIKHARACKVWTDSGETLMIPFSPPRPVRLLLLLYQRLSS